MPKKTKKTLVIQDKAIVAVKKGLVNPVGEAPTKDSGSMGLMNEEERQAMLHRLEVTIKELMDEAQGAHEAKQSDGSEINPDYITRLSTNEFFFYTQEPLTLNEFEELQNKIAAHAEDMSEGVHLILGSFAVKTDEDKVMNVTPHIVCGPSPEFHFLLKNFTSPIDVQYKIPDGMGNIVTLPILEMCNSSQSFIPQITINGTSKGFSFNNIISCKTPGGTPFITAIDLCLDHEHRVAKTNFINLAKDLIKQPIITAIDLCLDHDCGVAKTNLAENLFKQPISHVVISNCIDLKKEPSIGVVMHVDPMFSPVKCKKGASQRAEAAKKSGFGRDPFIVFDVEPQEVKPLIGEINNSYSNITQRNHSFNTTTINELELQNNSAEFQDFKSKYQAYKGDYLKTEILKCLKERIEDTQSLKELDNLKKELKDSYEIKTLKDPQGWFTQRFGVKTSSLKALQSMIEQQEKYLSNAGFKY